LKASASGQIPAGSRVVCTITGNGLKDPDWALSGAPAPATIPADPAAAAPPLRPAQPPPPPHPPPPRPSPPPGPTPPPPPSTPRPRPDPAHHPAPRTLQHQPHEQRRRTHS